MPKPLRTPVVAAIAAAASLGIHAAAAQQPGIRRVDLQRHDLSAPGREVIQARVEFDPGAAFPRHYHPGEEIIFVLDGSLEYQLGDDAPVTLRAGDVLFVPARVIHSARNVSDAPAAELATYVVEKGQPLLVTVP